MRHFDSVPMRIVGTFCKKVSCRAVLASDGVGNLVRNLEPLPGFHRTRSKRGLRDFGQGEPIHVSVQQQSDPQDDICYPDGFFMYSRDKLGAGSTS